MIVTATSRVLGDLSGFQAVWYVDRGDGNGDVIGWRCRHRHATMPEAKHCAQRNLERAVAGAQLTPRAAAAATRTPS
jgi:hypothetical protein